MSWTHKQRISVVAIVILIVAVPVLWQIGNVRAGYAVEETQQELVNQSVTTPHSQIDYDGDGIDDEMDRCPTRPETENGYQDSDGCPDLVAATGAS